MQSSKPIFLAAIFGIPFMLGITILGYWFYTTQMEKRTLLPEYGQVPQFNLTTERNNQFTQANLIGKVTIADFMFTECGGACPMMSAKMEDLNQKFSTDPNVQFLSFSVDPESDSPQVLAEYARQYKAKPRKWTFLTGSKKSIYTLSKDGFHLALNTDAEGAIMHSEKFVLIDHHGAIRGYYDSNDDQEMKLLIRDAGILSDRVTS